MFNNNETEVHIPLHRALRVRRGGRYQYYKQHDGLLNPRLNSIVTVSTTPLL
jgi:hypothetical protein